MNKRFFWGLGLTLTLGVAFFMQQVWHLTSPMFAAMYSRKASEERLRRYLNRKMSELLEEKRGVPYDKWEARYQLYYQCLRAHLAEEGQSLPERPDCQ